jgi:hypothetical protein
MAVPVDVRPTHFSSVIGMPGAADSVHRRPPQYRLHSSATRRKRGTVSFRPTFDSTSPNFEVKVASTWISRYARNYCRLPKSPAAMCTIISSRFSAM